MANQISPWALKTQPRLLHATAKLGCVSIAFKQHAFQFKNDSKTGTAKEAGTANNERAGKQQKEEQRARKNQSTNTEKIHRRRQQRAKREDHGFVLILCNNAILFRHFPPLVQPCFFLSWLKCNIYQFSKHLVPLKKANSSHCEGNQDYLASTQKRSKKQHSYIAVFQNGFVFSSVWL